MTDINNVTVTGRLTRDAEIKYTNSGLAISKFSIASNYSKKTDSGWEEQANFFDCTMMGKRAEGLNGYLTKGTLVAIGGELRQNRWEQDGQKRSKVGILVNDISMMSQKRPVEKTLDDGVPF